MNSCNHPLYPAPHSHSDSTSAPPNFPITMATHAPPITHKLQDLRKLSQLPFTGVESSHSPALASATTFHRSRVAGAGLARRLPRRSYPPLLVLGDQRGAHQVHLRRRRTRAGEDPVVLLAAADLKCTCAVPLQHRSCSPSTCR